MVSILLWHLRLTKTCLKAVSLPESRALSDAHPHTTVTRENLSHVLLQVAYKVRHPLFVSTLVRGFNF